MFLNLSTTQSRIKRENYIVQYYYGFVIVYQVDNAYEMNVNEFSSKNVKAFYLDKGDVVEIYGTTLHFCPCQVSDNGFSCVVVLPKNTNTLLDKPSEDKLLFKRNKWLICHDENKSLIEKGVYPGLHGINYEIKYRK